jgi:hypothetical protein
MKRELRSKSVGTKVTEAELRVLESRAERAGLTLSEWVRDVLLGSSVEMGTLAAERAILAEVPAIWWNGTPVSGMNSAQRSTMVGQFVDLTTTPSAWRSPRYLSHSQKGKKACQHRFKT